MTLVSGWSAVRGKADMPPAEVRGALISAVGQYPSLNQSRRIIDKGLKSRCAIESSNRRTSYMLDRDQPRIHRTPRIFTQTLVMGRTTAISTVMELNFLIVPHVNPGSLACAYDLNFIRTKVGPLRPKTPADGAIALGNGLQFLIDLESYCAAMTRCFNHGNRTLRRCSISNDRSRSIAGMLPQKGARVALRPLAALPGIVNSSSLAV